MDAADQLFEEDGVGALDDDVGGGRSGRHVEAAPAAGRVAEAVARHQRGGRGGSVHAELVLDRWVIE